MVIAGRIQRYIFRECVTSLALTLGIILLAIVLVDVVEQMRTIGGRTQIGIDMNQIRRRYFKVQILV